MRDLRWQPDGGPGYWDPGSLSAGPAGCRYVPSRDRSAFGREQRRTAASVDGIAALPVDGMNIEVCYLHRSRCCIFSQDIHESATFNRSSTALWQFFLNRCIFKAIVCILCNTSPRSVAEFEISIRRHATARVRRISGRSIQWSLLQKLKSCKNLCNTLSCSRNLARTNRRQR